MVLKDINKQYNKSATFLLPMLNIKLDLFGDFYNVYYKTIYNKDENQKRIYLVYKSDINEDIITTIKKSGYYINEFNIDGFRVIIYKVPWIYTNDFCMFCNGKYNYFTNNYKKLLISTYKFKKKEFSKILNTSLEHRKEKAEELGVNIDQINEVFPIPDEIEETFSVSNNYKLEI